MKNGVIVFKKEEVPEKGLVKVVTYSYHPTPSMKEQIIEDMKINLKCDLEEYVIGIDVYVNLKEYDHKPEEKKFWYDKLKPTDDTKNT